MEIRTFTPEDVKSVATTAARSIPADQIDATFKSQYTGTMLFLS
jgi:allantoicase